MITKMRHRVNARLQNVWVTKHVCQRFEIDSINLNANRRKIKMI